jgi:hypothetical protein
MLINIHILRANNPNNLVLEPLFARLVTIVGQPIVKQVSFPAYNHRAKRKVSCSYPTNHYDLDIVIEKFERYSLASKRDRDKPKREAIVAYFKWLRELLKG